MRETIKFKQIRVSKETIGSLAWYAWKALGVDLGEYVDLSRVYQTCFDDTCLIYALSSRAPNTIFDGAWIGVSLGGKAVLSTLLYTEVFNRVGYRAAVIASEKGVRAFLYGNDLLYESIIEIYEPIDSFIAVVDSSDKTVIGVAELDRERRVFRNIYDLGIFLRILG
ncbi:hypothetical protein ACSU1N_06200 [Thermogladius sp. 4427co]|uniref:hypothetical protein n=1 Tax=Thermogladius sp. 4427co TaxID=3450718 RepID=UPI003F7A7F5A